MADLPVVVTTAGAQPTPPAVLLANLIAAVAAVTPGYTANLPGSMIEDVSSTEVGGLAVCDSARVETINSLTPRGANAFVLSQLGQIYIGPGAAPGVPSNTSVSVVFQGPPGFVIDVGFTVSDGTYQYIVQDGGIIAASGFSSPLFCLATIAGSWAVATNTVTQVVTSVPSTVTLTCTNPVAGTPGEAAETETEYRARVLQAGQAVAQGMPSMLKTLLANVSGVQTRLVSVLQKTDGWVILVGGGDPYEVAYAIFTALFDVSSLVGSTLDIVSITQASPGVVTTALNHGLTTGDVEEITDVVGMVALNGNSYTVTVIDEKSFSIGINTSGYPAYVSGGVVSPNPRNVTVSINDYPDVYSIPFVSPPIQTVTVAATWSTTADNFVSQASVAQLAAPAIAAYINSIIVGAPINVLVMESTFLASIAGVLAASQVSQLVFAVSINGISTPPDAGTKLISGDPESYFQTSTAAIAVAQG